LLRRQRVGEIAKVPPRAWPAYTNAYANPEGIGKTARRLPVRFTIRAEDS